MDSSAVATVSNNEETKEIASDKDSGIEYLLKTIPAVNEFFNVHYKVGEGTFSSVYLATLKSSEKKKKFAIKHLIPTCHPERMERELKCLQEIGGTDFVVGIDLCVRNNGHIAFVMPYMRHDKFADYVTNMTVEETKSYMRALLTALRRVHKFNIIHRDIKPINFLYDRKNRRYLLVDFGLAQEYKEKTVESEIKPVTLDSPAATKLKKLDENKPKDISNSNARASENKCYCFGKPKICSICIVRKAQTAGRAGTPGYRAPEVLLKYPFQTSAIDIWSCGVIMICILSKSQPFFRAPNDVTALAEITSIFGSARMQQVARKLGKNLIYGSNIPPIDIVSLCQKLQQRNNRYKDSDSNADKSSETYPSEAYDLLIRLLDVEYKTRTTAEQALKHPFLLESL